MARKKAEKLGIRDIAAAWKAGWTPDEVNGILDRLEAMGDPNDPDEENSDAEDEADEEDETDESEESGEEGNEDSEDDSDDSDDSDNPDDSDNNSLDANMKKLKKLASENSRLKSDLKKLQAKNKIKDVSGGKYTKTPEESLIDVFQSCF